MMKRNLGQKTYAALMSAAAILGAGSSAQAQTAPANVGAVISIDNSRVSGDIKDYGFNGSYVAFTGIDGVSNPYGGYVSAQVNLAPVSGFSSFGVVQIQNSLLDRSNIGAYSFNGAVVSNSAFGFGKSLGVGSVDQLSADIAQFTKPTLSGTVNISNTTVNAGDVVAVDVTNSAVVDVAAAGARTNNYGGYDSLTINFNGAKIPVQGSTAGSIFATASIMPASNMTAFDSVHSILTSGAYGQGPTRYDSVGSVVKLTVTGFAPN